MVPHVADDRTPKRLAGYFASYSVDEQTTIKVIAMDA